MSKRKRATTPAARNSARIVFFEGTVTINGVTRTIASDDYSRVEYEDGTVVESGRPPNLPPDATISDVLAAAFAPLVLPAKPKPRTASLRKKARR